MYCLNSASLILHYLYLLFMVVSPFLLWTLLVDNPNGSMHQSQTLQQQFEPFLHFSIPTMTISIFSYGIDDLSANLEFFCLGSNHTCWILVID